VSDLSASRDKLSLLILLLRQKLQAGQAAEICGKAKTLLEAGPGGTQFAHMIQIGTQMLLYVQTQCTELGSN